MVVGHNPGLEELATLWRASRCGARNAHGAMCWRRNFPPPRLAVLDFDIERWRDLKPGTGKLADFVRPKDL